MKRKILHIIILLLVGLSTAAALGQEFTGTVTDQSGAVIPKAKITVHNQDTGVNLTTVTTGSGNYTVPYLSPGHYSVSAAVSGFKKENKVDIALVVGKTAVINFKLQVGGAEQTVTVNANTALLDKGKADQGEVIGKERVTELPLDGGDPGMLSTLVAGALWTGSPQWQRPFDDTQANLSINGGGAGNTALMLDGITNSAASTNNSGQAKISYVPPTDAVQEFKIVTNPYDAKYGLFAGGVEDVVLKSGTNHLHGDVYEFARRTWLDANTWQNDYDIHTATPGTDVTPYETPNMKWDQWGGELNGPVVIPKLYNGRDKSFFTLVYQNFHEVEPNTITESVPSPQWVTGDFSNLTYWNGSGYSPITLYDPLSIHQIADGQWVRDPFGPNDPVDPTSAPNIIPASRINAMAAKIISLYPKPNTTPPAGSNPFANNYTVPGNDVDQYRNVLGKWNENISSKDRFSLLYGYWERVEHRSFDGFTGPEQQGQLPHGERSNTFTFEETHIFTPNLVFNFRANVGVRYDYSFHGPEFDPTELGYSSSQLAEMGPSAQKEFPDLNISEFAGMGTNSNGQTISNQLALFPSITWVKNRQTINIGLDARFMQSVNDIVGGGNYFWIDRTWTQYNCGSCGSWDPASGNSIASLLLGNPTSGNNSINVPTFWSSHYWAPFVQDDWKVTPKLTLNLGVRWDFLPAGTERHNRGNYAFDTTGVSPINGDVTVPGYSQMLGGVRFLGVNGAPRAPYKLDLTNIQPRVGFAYAIHDKTVIRAGFGESMRAPQNAPSTFGYSSTTQYQGCDPAHIGCTYPNLANPISNPFSSVVQPSGASRGMREMLGQGPWFLNPNYKTPSFWNYSAGIQHQFLRNNIVNIAYVGSQLFDGDSSDNINRESAAAYASCNPQIGGRIENCSNNNVTNPFKGVNGFQGSNYYTSTTLNALNFTRPYPAFGGITEYQLNDGHTWYNALQVTAMHRWSGGIVLHGTWTWSKLMGSGGWTDETYRVPYRSISSNDHTHRITLSGVYMLPVGRGRMFLGKANRVVDTLIGGWELASMYTYQSGSPWMIPGNPNEVYLHSAWVKPHIQSGTGFIRIVAACAEQYQENSNGVYELKQLPYNYHGACPQGADFQQVPNYGKTPNTVYSGIRIPSSQEFDTNLSKSFAIVRNLKLQLRLDAFNVLNHPNWAENPDGSTNDSNFGLILRGVWGQSNLPRQMQLAMKLMW